MTYSQLFKRISSICFTCLSIVVFGQEHAACGSAAEVIKIIKAFHYAPIEVDDNFSQRVFDQFIDEIDPKKRILTSTDLIALGAFELDLDDQINEASCEFLDLSSHIFGLRLAYTDSLLYSFERLDFKPKMTGQVRLGNEEMWSPDEFATNWQDYITYLILKGHMNSKEEHADVQSPSKVEIEQLRDRVISNKRCELASSTGGLGVREYVNQAFLKAVALAFDPHSEYLSPQDEMNFNSSLRDEEQAFGFEVSINEFGEAIIGDIVPGSPAWHSSKLNIGDRLVAILIGDQGEKHDVDCRSINQVMNELLGNEVDQATFYLEKESGKIEIAHLFKETVQVQDNIIQSFILDGDDRVGYMYLPSFYLAEDDFDRIANGAANDIAKELLNLKRDGIQGLILDLRGNGGGSVMEAIKLADLFIDFGTITIMDSRIKGAENMKGLHRGMIFSKPLIVLVSPNSASASELFAAAMQDYNRAVIVGTETFGKSSTQVVIPMPNGITSPSRGAVKVTTGMNYRVNATCAQYSGVTPDIKLPHVMDSIEFGECTLPYALKVDTIDKKSYYRALPSIDVDDLRANSETRVVGSQFDWVRELSIRISRIQSQMEVPLEFEQFKAWYMEYIPSSIHESPPDNPPYQVKNPSYIQSVSSSFDNEAEVNHTEMEDIMNDIYIHETYLIMQELIHQ